MLTKEINPVIHLEDVGLHHDHIIHTLIVDFKANMNSQKISQDCKNKLYFFAWQWNLMLVNFCKKFEKKYIAKTKYNVMKIYIKSWHAMLLAKCLESNFWTNCDDQDLDDTNIQSSFEIIKWFDSNKKFVPSNIK